MPVTLVHVCEGEKERRVLVRDGSSLEIRATGLGPQGGAVLVTSTNQGMCTLDNRSRVRCLVNGVEVQKASICPGDSIHIGAEIYHVEPVTHHDIAQSQARTSRRITTARLPGVTSTDGRRGFLRRFGRMLAARGQRAHYLRSLEEERERIWREAGRYALQSDAGLGLPEQVLIDLHGHRPVTIQPADIQAAQLERWRQLRDQIRQLDAEIALVRAELHLEPDPARLAGPQPTLLTEKQHRQERCFAALDGQDTLPLPPDLEALTRLSGEPPPRPA